MAAEPTQPGNPHQLTINQHVLPRSLIARFAGQDGCVHAQRISGAQPFKVKPDHPMFCAQRVWDHGTETFRASGIEGTFASLCDRLISGATRSLSADDDAAVTQFYGLWNLRHRLMLDPPDNAGLNIAAPERTLTAEQEEALEAKGVLFVRGTSIPGRQIAGLSLMREIDRMSVRFRGFHWGVVRASEGEFLVPDNSVNVLVVPIAPAIFLVGDSADITISAMQVAEFNGHMLHSVHAYYLARDLDACPVLRGPV